MKQIRQQLLPFERMTSEPGHNFFGYYDLQPWSSDGRSHLCQRVGFMDRLPAATDPAELGLIRMSDYQFVPLATTYAWNFQQGSMLQWHPRQADEIIHNAVYNGVYRGVIRNIVTGESRLLPRPVANVASTGTHALSVNFSRMFDFRPGYGYAGIPDSAANVPTPADDGIFLMDLATGQEKLIIPFPVIAELFAKKFKIKNAKLLVNHITFNPAGNRFVFLVRNMPLPGATSDGWLTLAATADIAGQDIHVLANSFAASHYIWRDNEHLLIYADMQGPWKMDLCLVEDRASRHALIQPDYFTFDGHCSYSPDKQFILYDSYPDADGYRLLLLYDIRQKKGLQLASLFSGKKVHQPNEDARCDLHPRWNRGGTAISFDSTHEGRRHVYTMDLTSCTG